MTSNNPEGRPRKLGNLGTRDKMMRVPRELHRELESLLTELDRIAVSQDPCEVLSGFCDTLSDIEIGK